MYTALGILLAAIACEVVASSALQRTEGFRDPFWTGFVVFGYALSIWLLAIVVRTMPVSTAYAIWAGLGTAAIALIGVVWMDDPISVAKVAALSMIVVGVVVLNLQGAH